MELTIKIEKLHFYVLIGLFVILFSGLYVKALSGDGLPWHPLRYISTDVGGTVSVDTDNDGIIDTAETAVSATIAASATTANTATSATSAASALSLTPTADVNMQNQKITNTASPTGGDPDSTVATKGYVLAQAGGSPTGWTCITVSNGGDSWSSSVNCPAGYQLITGGCKTNCVNIENRPNDNGWYCGDDCHTSNIWAYARCCQ